MEALHAGKRAYPGAFPGGKMNKASLSIVLSIVSLTIFLSITASAQEPKRPEKWEYKFGKCSSESELNKEGDEGWELVAVFADRNSSCLSYFKRPKREYFNPPPATPPPPAPPTCSLTISQAPVFYGIRLGMSTDELLALFPRSKEQSDIIKSISKAETNYGRVDLTFYSSTYPENKTMFTNNVGYYTVTLLDNRVSSIYLSYNFSPGVNRSYDWTNVSWIQKLSETYNLPKFEDWRDSGITCQGFRINVNASGNSASISTASLQPASNDETRKRHAAESEKLRRAFKP
jgi:hypothetical protein